MRHTWKSLDGADFKGKRVLVRVDYNVPMQEGEVTNDERIIRSIPTIKMLLGQGANIVLVSHMGRPSDYDEALSLAPIVPILEQYLGQSVHFIPGEVKAQKEGVLGAHRVILLDNLRFSHGETKNSLKFARVLASFADVYVNDAFSASHREHTSVTAITQCLPSYAGLLLDTECKTIEKLVGHIQDPSAAIVGGAKVSTKIDLLKALAIKVDTLVVGGGMANTFLAAEGHEMGGSFYEAEGLDAARQVKEVAQENGCNLMLPKDVVVASEFKAGAKSEAVGLDAIAFDKMALDVGPQTVIEIIEVIKSAKTLIWNGPLGVFEKKPFDIATNAVAEFVASQTQEHGLLSVAGGGDTLAALKHAGVLDKLTYTSTAGGAFLEWLEGKELPGLAALNNNAL